MLLGGVDEDGKPAPGMIEIAVDKMFSKAQYTAMGEESGVSKRRTKLLGDVVIGIIPPAVRLAMKHGLGWDDEYIREIAPDLIALWPQIKGLMGGEELDLSALMGIEGMPAKKEGGTFSPGMKK